MISCVHAEQKLGLYHLCHENFEDEKSKTVQCYNNTNNLILQKKKKNGLYGNSNLNVPNCLKCSLELPSAFFFYKHKTFFLYFDC